MTIPYHRKLLAAMVAVALTSCGSDTSTSSNNGASQPAQAQSIRAVGEIDGFGSVIVNGVRYDTDNASVFIDGEPGAEGQLEVGQIVELLGKLDEKGKGSASKVFMRTRVGGVISNVDAEARSFGVMGYVVTINEDTKLDSGINEVTLEGLAEGIFTYVSGLPGNDGGIIATRVDLHEGADTGVQHNRLFGDVKSVDANTMSLVVDGKTVDYSSAMVEGDLDGLVMGSRVLARGILMEDVLVAEKMFVISARVKEDGTTIEIEPGTKIEVSGTLAFNGETFTLDGKLLEDLDDAAIVRGKIQDLIAGLKIEVEGTETETGIEVDRVKIQKTSQLTVVGAVDSVNAESSSLVVSGETFNIQAETDFIDGSSTDMQQFSLADIVEGDLIKVRGYKPDTGEAIANLVKKIDRTMMSAGRHFGRLSTNVASKSENSLVTTGGVTVTLTEETFISHSIDLENLVLGEEGDQLVIIGVYDAENALTARAILSDFRNNDEGSKVLYIKRLQRVNSMGKSAK